MKIESAIVVIITLCIFLTFYFSLLSLQTFDDALKRQLVVLASLSLLTGAIIFGCLTIYISIRKAFARVELRKSETLNMEKA
ncbi:MAG: hypothetical protein QXU21_04935 [Candidatus Bathyarchaeia archaeon]